MTTAPPLTPEHLSGFEHGACDCRAVTEGSLGSCLECPQVRQACVAVTSLQASAPRSCELECVVWMTRQVCLVGESCEHVRAKLRASSFLGQTQRLDEISLRENMLSIVEGHPADEVELLCPRLVERLACVR